MGLSYAIGVLAALITLTAAAQPPAGATYGIVAAASRIEVGVFREGVLKLFGHDHLIAARSFSGAVQLDAAKMERSSVTLSIEANSLTVLDTGLPEKDRREVQATMLGGRVLAVESFPLITFRSTGVSQARKAGAEWEVTLTGKLNLHGVERPVTLPVRLRFDDGRLHAQGELFIAQTDFGIKPVTVAGGMVRAKDRVRVGFDIVAERGNP